MGACAILYYYRLRIRAWWSAGAAVPPAPQPQVACLGLAERREGSRNKALRSLFWTLLAGYAAFGVFATASSAFCPALGSGEGFGERFDDCWFAVVYAAGLSFLCLPLPLILVCVELGDMVRAAQ